MIYFKLDEKKLMALLEIRKIGKTFGGLVVLEDIDLEVNSKEILGLIGPNGAGKTTLFNLVVGVHRPTFGDIIFQGEDISRLRSHEIAERGIIKTFQANVLFRDLTVEENIIVGHHLWTKTGFLKTMFNSPKAGEDNMEIKNNTAKILKYFDLEKRRKELAGQLPHGYQRLLGIAMAMAARPKLLLLDEPVTGMNAEESSLTVKLIRGLKESGITIVIIEHDMKVVMNLCEQIAVINFGKKIAEGCPEEIKGNRNVIEAYLGVE